MTNGTVSPVGARQAIPAGVWALGCVSMLMDISSEMIHALLPVYMVTVLGASAVSVGIIEGIAEATASITKVFSGALSDWLGKRKVLVAIGYGLAALTKPVFPLSASIEGLAAARFLDRIGKGIRGAPRDALIADITPPHLRGASFGLRQSLDTLGSFLGPLAAIGLMWLTAGSYQMVFWVAVVPALLSVCVVLVAVKEPERPRDTARTRMPLRRDDLSRLGAPYWWTVLVASVFTLARFSEAFLILRAQSAGLPLPLLPAVLIVMNVAYSLSAYPAGVLSDRMNRTTILILGLMLLVLADVVLAFAPGILGVGIGLILWGLHMGFTQGLLAALVADAAPSDRRGTAFGMFNLITGIALLLASVTAGALWDIVGPRGTFLVGAGFALLAAAGLLAIRNRAQTPRSAPLAR